MTRRERRGMALILVAVALMLLAAVVARCHHETVPAVDKQVEISQFDSETDSAAAPIDAPTVNQKPEHGKSASSLQGGRPSRPAAKPAKKPSSGPRHLDPVPGF